jgi:endonuclease YncB( thermonuclease family)
VSKILFVHKNRLCFIIVLFIVNNGLIGAPTVFGDVIQIQSEFNSQSDSVLSQSNSSNTPGEDKLTNNNTFTNNNSPSTESKLDSRSSTVKCEGSALCVTGEVVKVINGKTFYVNIQNKVYKVELALIDLPTQSEEAMRAATTFTRNTCLGSNVLIDQDDGQKINSFVGQVYCSPTKNLNSMLLQTGYVQLDRSQCQTSEFSKFDWAKSGGC